MTVYQKSYKFKLTLHPFRHNKKQDLSIMWMHSFVLKSVYFRHLSLKLRAFFTKINAEHVDFIITCVSGQSKYII